jgi:transforming growth factor-beta-induced protein
MASDVVGMNSAETLQGSSFAISVVDGKVMIGEAEVIITDIEAANGTVHVIDSVIIPQQEIAKNIVDIAVEDGRFGTLVAALQAAELDGALAGEGPFTVFAPTDDAFSKLPEGTVEALLDDIPSLSDILSYHVVPGNLRAADVVVLDSAKTLQGQSVGITVIDGKVLVDDAEVIITDIEAANGTIHVIDSVILPKQEVARTIVDIAVEDGRFSTLVAALQAAELDGTLMGEGPFTVFAPTDDAFNKLPEGTVEALLKDIPALTDILLYHVVSGNVLSADVVGMEFAETLQGNSFGISVMDGKVMVDEAVVIITDIEAANGTIHVIDSVILPGGTT